MTSLNKHQLDNIWNDLCLRINKHLKLHNINAALVDGSNESIGYDPLPHIEYTFFDDESDSFVHEEYFYEDGKIEFCTTTIEFEFRSSSIIATVTHDGNSTALIALCLVTPITRSQTM